MFAVPSLVFHFQSDLSIAQGQKLYGQIKEKKVARHCSHK